MVLKNAANETGCFLSGSSSAHLCIFTQGPRPAMTAYQQLNAPPVVPEGFENWSAIMDTWGNKVCCAQVW